MQGPIFRRRFNYLCTDVFHAIKMAPSLAFDGRIVRAHLGATHTAFERKNASWLASNVFCRRFVSSFGLD